MVQPVPDIVKQMSLSEIIQGVILLKKGRSEFRDEALEYGLRHTLESVQDTYHELVAVRSGDCGDKATGFDDAMFFLGVGGVMLTDAGDFQHTIMKHGIRKFLEDFLKKEYGADVLEKLRPFADAVWDKAKEYNPFMSY